MSPGRLLKRVSLAIFVLPGIASGQGQLQCQRSDVPATVRAEGVTELLNDIVLTCTGGLPTLSGNPLPAYNLLVTATVPLTSRALQPSNQGSGLGEALLLINDPGVGDQIGCVPQTGGLACPEVANASANPNVFQGRQIQYNVIAFRNVPINSPGGGGVSTLRITNLRADVSGGTLQAAPQTSVTLNDANGGSVPIQNATLVVANVLPGAVFSLRSAADQALPVSVPALTVAPNSLIPGLPQAAQSLNVKFTEGYPSAFKRRNIGTNSQNPLFTTVQATPGLNYGTESGFFNSLLPASTGMNLAGLADTGTRLRIVFLGVPDGVGVWVSARDVAAGTTGYAAANPKAVLTAADGNGLGPLTVQQPQTGTYIEIPVVNGTASADWEVINADPSVLEDFSFAVAVTAIGLKPSQGTATIAGGLAPLAGETAVTIPAFRDVSKALPGISISNVISSSALSVFSAATLSGSPLAPGSIASAFGSHLAASIATPVSLSLPTSLGGSTVTLIDAAGNLRPAALYLMSPGQVNFVLDPQTAPGLALVLVQNGAATVASGAVQVDPVAPGLFSANSNGAGVAAGQVLRSVNGVTTVEPIATYDKPNSRWIPASIRLADNDLVFLTLYGTGIRNRANLSDVRVTMNSAPVPVTYAGPQPDSPGLDQINIGPLPPSLTGSGAVQIRLSIGSSLSNAVTIQVQ